MMNKYGDRCFIPFLRRLCPVLSSFQMMEQQLHQKVHFSFLCMFICLVSLTACQPDFVIFSCSNSIGNYTQNSIFQTNLNTVLSSLAPNINPNGFYNSSSGQNEDRVNAILLCRADLDLETCRGCVNDSVRKITQVCPNQKEAIGWYDGCMIRYSSNSIFGVMNTENLILLNRQKAPTPELFNQEVSNLAGTLRNQAFNGSFRKVAAGSSNNTSLPTIYGYMQCTPDITAGDCDFCLRTAADTMPDCCNASVGARVLTPSCSFHYEIYTFIDETALQLPPGPPQSPAPEGKNSNATVIIIVCVVVAALFITGVGAFIFICRRKRQKAKRGEKLDKELEEIDGPESVQYDLGVLKAATANFSNINRLGRGGFGDVYKGTLPDGKQIAVKRLSKSSGQGEKEFRNEAKLLAKLQHKSLVRLLGFCLEKTERLLVYEFLSNGSLDHFLFDSTKRSCLDWEMRHKIIEGIARGLLYLHEDSRLRIIHRDLKASNVLLDEEMNAKISDFGMARLFQLDESVANTNRIVGTYGYMAPEYAMHGLFSIKSDVYSYGVLILEIISGQRNRYFQDGESVEDLLSYAYKKWVGKKALDVVDPTLKDHSGSMETIMRCMHIGLLCVQDNAASRPAMASIVLMLHSFALDLPIPSQPGFFTHSSSLAPSTDRSLQFEFSNTRSSEISV